MEYKMGEFTATDPNMNDPEPAKLLIGTVAILILILIGYIWHKYDRYKVRQNEYWKEQEGLHPNITKRKE